MILFLLLILRDREREREQGRGRERETQAVVTDAGLNPTNHEIMTQAKIKSQTLNRLSHPGAPPLRLI